MNYFKISLGIFIALAASRFFPHPPNFTSLIALSFYVPTILGRKYIPAILLSFILTDIFIGFHSTIFFTWGSVLIVCLISKYFFSTILSRISGALFGASIFYFITNFGVWTGGMYGYTLEGLFTAYLLGLPFFGYSLISTFIFSTIIETIIKFFGLNLKTN
tara:strand:+ start:583 stop:1065 length:483 start_codon:yes stop_codon:yes gene_type:complete